VNTYCYSPEGLVGAQETIPNPFQYVGRFGVMAEGNGLYYMRARYYDPEVGRFINKDPIGYGGGTNLFMYVGNNLVSRIDPLGLTDLIYDYYYGLLIVVSKEGEIKGMFPASNNAQIGSRGKWPAGEYKFLYWKEHPESGPNDTYGSNGNFVFYVPGCSGCGVHSGHQGSCDKANRCGYKFATNGCIRTTDEATALIRKLHENGDPVKRLHVFRQFWDLS
jgi:RHS repeat-associated protein